MMELLVGFGVRYARANILLWVHLLKAVMLQSFKTQTEGYITMVTRNTMKMSEC